MDIDDYINHLQSGNKQDIRSEASDSKSRAKSAISQHTNEVVLPLKRDKVTDSKDTAEQPVNLTAFKAAKVEESNEKTTPINSLLKSLQTKEFAALQRKSPTQFNLVPLMQPPASAGTNNLFKPTINLD